MSGNFRRDLPLTLQPGTRLYNGTDWGLLPAIDGARARESVAGLWKLGAGSRLDLMQPADLTAAERAEAVRQAMLHAWRGYERFAMGAAELRPVSKRAKQDIMGGQGISGLGVTVVDAMSTLHVMGLKDEFDRCRTVAMSGPCVGVWAASCSCQATLLQSSNALAAAFDSRRQAWPAWPPHVCAPSGALLLGHSVALQCATPTSSRQLHACNVDLPGWLRHMLRGAV
jgi:hypothetical protein